MMSFGWRTPQSCYQPVHQYQKVIQQAPCEAPSWFWWALGIATVAGMSSWKK